MNNTLRKDAKRDCCFEISAPDKRVYQVGHLLYHVKTSKVYSYPQIIIISYDMVLLQFCAASEKEAREWVEHIDFLIKGRTVIL